MPEGSVLEAELFVPSRAIGFIDEGQEVRLLFDAFPYQRFGSFPAEIKAVSGAIMAPEESGAPFPLNEATYRVLARLDEQSLLIADSSVALQSGMKLTANIVLERRSFMDWLLEPLRAVARRSSRGRRAGPVWIRKYGSPAGLGTGIAGSDPEPGKEVRR